mmetsp:Transcript_51696/g.76614  ORF Transcript_51696/g.76614 Transcript_51696/m.76614 type:complete len:321 (-) Transcript_51696:326-1288(-)|eukprot:CAMPEP_0195517774 /NCGR_PEP_ID=MMETSP0794_2-20130614/11648_1 /TAXON_ID=515487 /ORGANISM="Stephanopyxis turris, Strain CCMP 815" /LENGTH=320 /DNA_ID=CAMNT_0040646645 /DNA_START=55 /DNA_END=1017 /DNA_ORIENTATION=+
MRVAFPTLVVALSAIGANSFTIPLFMTTGLFQKKAQNADGLYKNEVIKISLPDIEDLISKIKKVSPLALRAFEEGNNLKDSYEGFEHLKDNSGLEWKVLEKNQRKTVHCIEKIDNFMQLGFPILRFRSSLTGPCLGEAFADFITTLEQRKKWDVQIADVDEVYSLCDLDTASQILNEQEYGKSSRLGVGHTQTKSAFGISPREQLTLCGVQNFDDGSCVIWGMEMEDRHNYLLPEGKRCTRTKTHIYSTTLTPTGENTFDVEYVLQLDTGGNLPLWITTPVMIITVKSLFKHAESFFADRQGNELQKYLKEDTKVLRGVE